MEDHIKAYPLSNGIKLDHLYYILNKLYTLPTLVKDIEDKNGFIPLSATKLKNRIRNYRNCLTYLLETGILETNNHYIPKERAKGFRFSKKYNTKVKPIHHATTSKIFEKTKSQCKTDYQSKRKYPELYNHLTNGLFTIDYEAANNFNTDLYEANSTIGVDNVVRKYNYNYIGIDKLKNQNYTDYTFTVDSTGKRLHTNLTLLSSQLRPYLKYDDEDLVSIDITNSQPFFSTLLFKPQIYDWYQSEQPNNIMKFFKYIDSNNILYSITMFRKLSHIAHNKDVIQYIDLVVNGTIYETLQEKIIDKFPNRRMKRYDEKGKEISVDLTSRKAIKKEFMLAVYSSNLYHNPFKTMFKELFPTVDAVFSIIRKGNKENLPILLQRMESYMILEVITKKIFNVDSSIPLFTIHDSIVTTTNNVDFVRGVMEDEIINFTGLKPTLDVEYWSESTYT